MKAFTVGMLACVLLIGLAAVALNSSRGSPLARNTATRITDQKSAELKVPDTLTTADSEGVPLYPGAQTRTQNCREGRPGRCVYYLSLPGSGHELFDEVMTFYKQVLPAKGWVLTEESKVSNGGAMLFVWTNAEGGVPARRRLNVDVGPSSEAGSTSIILDFERWADPNKVPLYQASGPADVRWESDPEYGYLERVTTYTTEATPDEVTAYYQDVMIQHGWWINKYSTYPGLGFMFDRGMEGSWRHSRVKIGVQTKNGQTTVELRVSGNEVKR